MKPTIRLGRVAGIPVGAHWSALAIALLLANVLATQVLPEMLPGRTGSTYWPMLVIGMGRPLGVLEDQDVTRVVTLASLDRPPVGTGR